MIMKYITVLTDNVAEETIFFSSVLGFKLFGEFELWPNVICNLLGQDYNDVRIAVVPRQANLEGKSLIILTTENCLQSFNHVRKSGVKIVSDPHYLPAGLIGEFESRVGNRFILLEERVYEEI